MFDRSPITVKLGQEKSRWTLVTDFGFTAGGRDWVIPAGFETDFASVPRWLHLAVFNATDYESSALLHDFCWQLNKQGGGPDPVLTDRWFRAGLVEEGCGLVRRWLAWWAVRYTAILSGRRGSWSVTRSVLFSVAPVAAVVGAVILSKAWF